MAIRPSFLTFAIAAIVFSAAEIGGRAMAVKQPQNPSWTAPAQFTISSEFVTAAFSSAGLVSVSVVDVPNVTVAIDSWTLAADGLSFNSSNLAPPTVSQSDTESIVFSFTAKAPSGSPTYFFNVTYEARAAWRFLRKTIAVLTSTPGTALAVTAVAPFDVLLLGTGAPLVGVVYPSGDMGTYGAFGECALMLLRPIAPASAPNPLRSPPR